MNRENAAEMPKEPAIDFHSAEFNRTDDLNDCSGNYLAFQTLDGVVTADMRHQMERLSAPDADAAAGCTAPAKGKRPRSEKEEAPRDAAPLTVVSRGRTLIVGTDDGRAADCAEILRERGLDCTLLLTDENAAAAPLARFRPSRRVKAGALSISGAFGGYCAVVEAQGDRGPFAAGPGDGASCFDLVLDLQAVPSYGGEALPLGYYAPGADPAALAEAMAELPRMKGRFERPQFTTFRQDRCLHGRSRSRDCRRCIAVCPFGAIASAERTIAIDPYRCQGCGGCSLVCPAEAIQAIHPSREEVLALLQGKLEERRDPLLAPILVISDGDPARNGGCPENEGAAPGQRIDFAVERIAYAGLEMLLAALACGAAGVSLACDSRNPPAIREAVERQVLMGRAILQGLGMPRKRIRFTLLPPEKGPDEKDPQGQGICAAGGPAGQPENPCPPALLSPGLDRRRLLRLATRHLAGPAGRPQPAIPLPEGSPFGAVAVDPAACTLCMACAAACPTGALSAGGDLPRLEFVEANCHQCGLCREACPEKALALSPRLLYEQDRAETPAILNEAEPFRCIVCGVPFATRAMIGRIGDKLAGHWMYAADRQLRRLKMCRTCRTQDALGSEEMRSWNRI